MNRKDAEDALLQDVEFGDTALQLNLGSECLISVRSNNKGLLRTLDDYFEGSLGFAAQPTETTCEILALDAEAPELPVSFVDWEREESKRGRKDSVFDLDDGRLVHKLRTGVMFLQGRERCIARGPLSEHPNQLINFVNTQYMNQLQRNGWLIAHAAGLVRNDKALGIAGFSGGGKSTLMLRLMDDKDSRFLSNDRLLLKRSNGDLRVAGVPKQPRANPGTLLNNPRLRTLIDPARLDELIRLSPDALWELEEKHDVHIRSVYGPGRIATGHWPLQALVLLDWHRNSREPTRLDAISPSALSELLGAVMKSPGPFYADTDGRFLPNGIEVEARPYEEILAGLPVFALRGTADFERAVNLLKAHDLA